MQYNPNMSSRMSQPVVRRPNLPLTARDELDLTQLRESPAFRRALHALSPSRPSIEGGIGEAVLLHAVFEAGLAAIRESAIEEGYRQLAAEYAEQSLERRHLSRRRLPDWAGEA